MKDIAPTIWPPGKRIGWYLIIDEFFFKHLLQIARNIYLQGSKLQIFQRSTINPLTLPSSCNT